MSSPPPATSPTSSVGPFSLPKKRPSLAIPNPPPKRRKPSSVSSASHPLRQTSFPPPESSPPASSPQRHASFSPSVSSVGGTGVKRRRKRRSGPSDARSTTTARDADTHSTTAAAPQDGAAAEDLDEDDEEDDTLLETPHQLSDAAKKQEQKHLNMLLSAFSEEQLDRYSTWRRVKLKKEIVRRITNQTLSQSVPAGIVTAINGFTKVFIGEIVEAAREVQAEWLVAAGLGKEMGRELPEDEAAKEAASTTVNGQSAANDTQVSTTSSVTPAASGNATASDAQEKTQTSHVTDTQVTAGTKADAEPRGKGHYTVEERDRGPLTPDHLREALRRYKKTRDGGSAGFAGLSMLGKEATASRAGGRCLFR